MPSMLVTANYCQENQMISAAEAACYGFDPRNRLPWDVRVLFKTHISSFIKVYIGKSMSILVTALGPLLSKPCFM